MRANGIYNKYVKRVMDVLLALVLIVLLIPVWLIVSLGIIIDSGRPIIYRQIRRGQFGENFTIYKFRTMVNGADKSGTSTAIGDSRITRIGSILRKTSLDELPQLFNVLKGDMSIVGFRPDIPRDTDNLTDEKWKLKPGITGYAQVNGRSTNTIEMAKNYENEYTAKVSFMLDFKIMCKTITVVFKKEGVN